MFLLELCFPSNNVFLFNYVFIFDVLTLVYFADLFIFACDFVAKKLPNDVNPRGVFACNELDLSEVKVYGFDYDYTLAHYKPSLEHLLYNLGRDTLLEKYKVCFFTLPIF